MPVNIHFVRAGHTHSVHLCEHDELVSYEPFSVRVLASGFSGRGGHERSLVMFSFREAEERFRDWALYDVITVHTYVRALDMVRTLRERFPDQC